MKFKVVIESKKEYKSTTKIVEAEELEEILLKDSLNIKGLNPDWYKADKINKELANPNGIDGEITKVGKRNYYYINFAK